jgi:predicted Zn-dependent peptidase
LHSFFYNVFVADVTLIFNDIRLMKNKIDFILPSLVPQVTVLDNGLKVYAFGNSDMDVVRMEFFFYNAGSANQDKIYSSSVTNNQISEGSSSHSAMEIANAIDYYGAFIEKTVDKESASICFYFLRKYQDNLISWFEEIIKDPAFPQTELDVYLQRLRQQYLVNQQKTDYLARVKFNEIVFGGNHPFGVIGKMEDFDSLERKDLINFYNFFYSSDECSIIIAGEIDDKLLGLLNKSFGGDDWKKEKVIGLKDYNKFFDLDAVKKTININQAVQASIRMGNTTISSKDKDFMGLSVLNCLLGGYFGSRLMQNIREDKGYTYGIGSVIYSYRDIGIFYISADVKQENCQDAIDEVYKEIDLLQNEKVGDEELNRVKNYLMGNILRSLDGSLELSDRFRPLLKYGFGTDYYQKYMETIRAIDAEELMRLSQKYFVLNQMTEIRVGNETIIK